MTGQQYYDMLVCAALDGTFPSITNLKHHHNGEVFKSDSTCMYRGPNGTRCVVGLIIPDEKYSIHLERKPVSTAEVAARVDIPEGMQTFQLRELQRLHDRLATSFWDAKFFIQTINSFFSSWYPDINLVVGNYEPDTDHKWKEYWKHPHRVSAPPAKPNPFYKGTV